MIHNGHMSIQRARKAQETILEAAVQAGSDMEAPKKLALLQSEIAQGELSANAKVPIVLNDSQKTQFRNEWRTYRELNANLIKHRGQEFSLIQGQCTQLLQDKMKQYTDWAVVSTSYYPLTLYCLI
jgi:pyruvate kinase